MADDPDRERGNDTIHRRADAPGEWQRGKGRCRDIAGDCDEVGDHDHDRP